MAETLSGTTHLLCLRAMQLLCLSLSPFIVSLSSHEEFCSSQPVTVQCNVTKPQDGAHFLLSWRCTDPQGMNTERVVLCSPGPIPDINCQFGEVHNIFGDCICNETVITAKATFNTTSVCDMMLFCSNGGADREGVSVTINGMCIYYHYHYYYYNIIIHT